MVFAIVYKGEVYDANIMSADGSSELEGWLQFEPEVPWLGYYVERNSPGSSFMTEQMEISLPEEPCCKPGVDGSLERRLVFSSDAPPGLLDVKVDGENLTIQGKPLSDYLHYTE